MTPCPTCGARVTFVAPLRASAICPVCERVANAIAAFVEACLDPPTELSRKLVAAIREGYWRTP